MAERSGNEFMSLQGGRRPGRTLGFSKLTAVRVSFSLAAIFTGSACNDHPAARVWPAGTVVVVDDIPVTSSEVAQDMLAIVLIEPQWGDAQLRRLAFNEVSLPRAVLRTRATKNERDAARRSIDEQLARIKNGTQVGPRAKADVFGHEVIGRWKEIGLVSWGSAMNLAVGEWSEVLEEPGAFIRVRLLERKEGPVPEATQLRLDRIEAIYTKPDPAANGEVELHKHHLTIVDPAWETIVPERTKYLMGVHEK